MYALMLAIAHMKFLMTMLHVFMCAVNAQHKNNAVNSNGNKINKIAIIFVGGPINIPLHSKLGSTSSTLTAPPDV